MSYQASTNQRNQSVFLICTGKIVTKDNSFEKILSKNKNDIISGASFSAWTVNMKTNQKSNGGSFLYLCTCKCGKKKLIESSSLRTGRTRSCGCSTLIKLKKALKGNKYAIGSPGQTGRTAFLICYKANAKSRKLNWNLSDEEAFKISQLSCTYCGSPPKHFYKTGSNRNRISEEAYKNGYFLANGLDRKNPKLGYENGNVVAACQRCNEGKMDLTEEEFATWIRRVLEWGKTKGWLHEAD